MAETASTEGVLRAAKLGLKVASVSIEWMIVGEKLCTPLIISVAWAFETGRGRFCIVREG